MKHPAEFFVKYLLVRDPTTPNGQVRQELSNLGFVAPDEPYIAQTRAELPPCPDLFNPMDQNHRPSLRYLRNLQIYDMFHQSPAVAEMMEYLRNPAVRMAVEQTILAHYGPARLDYKVVAHKLNKKNNWKITEAGIQTYEHYFWNVKLLTFEQWGAYLNQQNQVGDRYLALLQAPTQLALFHLRLDQTLESRRMIEHAQQIAYCTLLEVSQKPVTNFDKVRSVAMLARALTECHEALSTSDAALSSILQQFEKFRMVHPVEPAVDIRKLAPAGNYTDSGVETKEQLH